MTENIGQMRDRHEREIAELRANCSHIELTNWIDYMWAPGHFAGKVRCCVNCGEVRERDYEALPTFMIDGG